MPQIGIQEEAISRYFLENPDLLELQEGHSKTGVGQILSSPTFVLKSSEDRHLIRVVQDSKRDT